jgi:transcriptional regulator with XRE-family HTH domain
MTHIGHTDLTEISVSQRVALTRICPTTQNPRVNAAELGARVRALRNEKGWSQEELADKSRVGRETIVRLEKGDNTTVETLFAVAGALQVPWTTFVVSAPLNHGDDVAAFEDVSGYVVDDLPVVFEGDASPIGTAWDQEGRLLAHISERISRPAGLNDKQAYGVRVRGDSMRPKYEPGDILVVSPNLPVRTGLRCYVQLKSGERLIKQVRRTMSGWMLESINQAYDSREVRDDEIEFMHRIIWAREKGDTAPGESLRVLDLETGRRVTNRVDEPQRKPSKAAEREDRNRFRGDDRDRSDDV